MLGYFSELLFRIEEAGGGRSIIPFRFLVCCGGCFMCPFFGLEGR
jgi:hypothetical protein